MPQVRLDNLVEFSEIPGYQALPEDEKRAVVLAINAAKAAKLNSENKIIVSPVRTREGVNIGSVLAVLHQVEDIQIRTTVEEETGRTLIRAIPDVTLQAAKEALPKPRGATSSSTAYSDLFKEMFGDQFR